eukprot:3378394-Amphidinium_carterae.1
MWRIIADLHHQQVSSTYVFLQNTVHTYEGHVFVRLFLVVCLAALAPRNCKVATASSFDHHCSYMLLTAIRVVSAIMTLLSTACLISISLQVAPDTAFVTRKLRPLTCVHISISRTCRAGSPFSLAFAHDAGATANRSHKVFSFWGTFAYSVTSDLVKDTQSFGPKLVAPVPSMSVGDDEHHRYPTHHAVRADIYTKPDDVT